MIILMQAFFLPSNFSEFAEISKHNK